jgi:hypothetical protein
MNICIYNYSGKRTRKCPLGSPRRRWVDNVKIDIIQKILELGGMDWIDLTHNRDQ